MSPEPAEIASAQLSDGSLAVAAVSSPTSLRSRVLSGSMIMLISSGMVGVSNFAYNILVARMLGAVEFGDAAAVYTTLLLLSCFTLSFQLVCSKFVAQNQTWATKAAVYRDLHHRAWKLGAVIALVIAVFSQPLTSYLHLPSRSYVLLIAVGAAFYVPLGVRRGLLQGLYDFRRLAINFVVEVLVKLGGALLLLALGAGVFGVVVAMVASVVIADLVAYPPAQLRVHPRRGLPPSFREGMQATVFFVGQVLINNVDIVLVKHFFVGPEAGLYAVISLVGRVVYMLSWSVVSSMFPISAGMRSDARSGRVVLTTAFALVVLVTVLALAGVWVAPRGLWRAILGPGFDLGGENPYTSLLFLYAAATGIYSFSVVLMMYEMSRRIVNTAWLQLATSGAVVLGISLFHKNLHQVIAVQLILMTVLLAGVATPLLSKRGRELVDLPQSVTLRQLRRISEDEVVSEFLKNEFYEPDYDDYRERLLSVVYQPDLTDARENKLRRALLFRRRGRMWQELPPDTEWWEVQLTPLDLERVRVFPRSHWLRVARGSFYVNDVVERLHKLLPEGSRPFLNKIRDLRTKLQRPVPPTAVLLIGIDAASPLTIIEGNHRMAAAMLVSPTVAMATFRFLCGFSPNMTRCCWYQTDFATLWKYGRNFLRDLGRDHDARIASMLESSQSQQDAA